MEREPKPEVPIDFYENLERGSEARTTWDDTTTIARIDCIHW